MAMTKKEQAEMDRLRLLRDAAMDRLRREAAMAKALAWPTFEKPEAMPRGEWNQTIHGWYFNSYNQRVAEGWSKGSFYTTNPDDPIRMSSGSRDHCPLYATEAEAYRAMIHELARKYAETLAGLYAKAGIEL